MVSRRMKLFASLSLLYASACAFQIPHNLPDGDYHVNYASDTTAKPVIKRISALSKRQQGPYYDTAGTGEYTITVNENAEEPFVETVVVDLHHDRARLPVPMEQTTLGCYDEIPYPLDGDDYRASKQSLYNWCSLYPFRWAHVELSLRGSVAVYVCARRRKPLRNNKYCSEAEYEAAEAHMNRSCGDGGAGFLYVSAWGKEYGRAWRGAPICPDKEGSSRTIPRIKGHRSDDDFVDTSSGNKGAWDEDEVEDGAMIDLEAEREMQKQHEKKFG